jgi:hypothetical protein
MLGMSKGWGRSVSSTLSAEFFLPAVQTFSAERSCGTAFQYGIKGTAWPMIEQNSTFYFDGPLPGEKQTFLTPGVVFGPFQIAERLHFAVGTGCPNRRHTV